MKTLKLIEAKEKLHTMACSLCYECGEDFIDFDEDKVKQLQIAQILYKYFPHCFDEEPKCGYVCRQCWCKVDDFHQFCIQIDEIHAFYNSNVNIAVNNGAIGHTLIDTKELTIIDTTIAPEETNSILPEESPKFNEVENNVTDNFDDLSMNDDYIDSFPMKEGSDENYLVNQNEHKQEDHSNEVNEYHDKHNESEYSGKSNKKDKKKLKSKVKLKLRTKQEKRADPVPKDRFKCDYCTQAFSSYYRLRIHTTDQHKDLKYKCKKRGCVAAFTEAEKLKEHKEAHVTTQCKKCGRWIQTRSMKAHIRQIHQWDQKVICDLCGRVSGSLAAHNYHYRAEHEVHSRIQCDICKEWYKNKENMRAHMKTIHIEGPQTCNICGRISPNKKSLNKHKKIHLEGSKEQFKCIVCGKGFRDRTKLKEHSYIHTGVTDAYICQFCGKAFRFGSSMYAHRRKAHPEQFASKVN